jgi:hypothetical protein
METCLLESYTARRLLPSLDRSLLPSLNKLSPALSNTSRQSIVGHVENAFELIQ